MEWSQPAKKPPNGQLMRHAERETLRCLACLKLVLVSGSEWQLIRKWRSR